MESFEIRVGVLPRSEPFSGSRRVEERRTHERASPTRGCRATVTSAFLLLVLYGRFCSYHESGESSSSKMFSRTCLAAPGDASHIKRHGHSSSPLDTVTHMLCSSVHGVPFSPVAPRDVCLSSDLVAGPLYSPLHRLHTREIVKHLTVWRREDTRAKIQRT